MKLVTVATVEGNTVDAPEIKKSKSLPAIIPTKVDAPKPEQDPDFDWSDPETEILPEQPRTAAYFNRDGSLVIRQQRWPDEDAIIVVAAASIDTFIDKLCDTIGIPSFGGP